MHMHESLTFVPIRNGSIVYKKLEEGRAIAGNLGPIKSSLCQKKDPL